MASLRKVFERVRRARTVCGSVGPSFQVRQVVRAAQAPGRPIENPPATTVSTDHRSGVRFEETLSGVGVGVGVAAAAEGEK
jgi:hypothetical protein